MNRLIIILVLLVALSAGWAAELPITQIVLFSSGVGYFQRAGTVKDDAVVQLSFKTEQINDLLKSLVLLDLDGGKVGAVTYGAKEPIGKTLQAFAIDITDNPSLGQLLDRLRGVPVEVIATNALTGKIVGVEKRSRAVEKVVLEEEVLNLLTDNGLRSVRLSEITSLRLLDDRLNKELTDALAVVASGLDNLRKPVTITFSGKGERHVQIGYVTETPIWKTSYRLVLGEKERWLQGWAVVENTSDADWSNIRLSLVSGRPISFIQDLYTPLYLKRPEVKPELFSSLQPVDYAGALQEQQKGVGRGEAALRLPMKQYYNGYVDKSAPAEMNAATALTTDGTVLSAANAVTEREMASVTPAALATDLGQAFAYNITAPVTLPRQQSALLPIVTGHVEAWKVSIYNAAVHPKFPLYGLRLKNTTGVQLMGGPITVYDGGVYAGDATITDLQPNEQRLISYAVDLGVIGEMKEAPQTEEIVTIKLAKGMLNITQKNRRTVQYTFAVKDGKERRLLVEHPYNAEYHLVQPEKPDERTDTLYRFEVPLTAKDGGKLTVIEENTTTETSAVIDNDTPTLVTYMKTGKLSPAVKAALQHVVELQSQLQDTRRQQELRQQEINTIDTEQNRLRQNMVQLDHTSDLYKRYISKLDLQETRIESLRKEIDHLHNVEQNQRKALEDYVNNLTLE